MIQFHRCIRQKLLVKKSFDKDVLYAFGQLLPGLLGVLTAPVTPYSRPKTL